MNVAVLFKIWKVKFGYVCTNSQLILAGKCKWKDEISAGTVRPNQSRTAEGKTLL